MSTAHPFSGTKAVDFRVTTHFGQPWPSQKVQHDKLVFVKIRLGIIKNFSSLKGREVISRITTRL